MTHRISGARYLVLAFVAALSACDSNNSQAGADQTGTTGGSTTGGTTTGGTTTGGTTGGTTTGGTTTGGTTSGGTTTGGTTTGGTTTGGTTTGGTTTGGTTGGGGSANATSCFDPIYGVNGTVVVASFRSTDSPSGEIITTNYTQTVGSGTLNGIPVTTASGPITTTGGVANTSSTQTSYYVLDNTAKTITSYGVDLNTTSPAALSSTIRFNPPRVDRADLNTGESYTETTTINTSNVVSGFTVATSTQSTVTRTFLGLEQITVPAGTFTACKFEDDTTSTTNGTTTTSSATLWNYGNGINLRTESGGDVSVLLSATVNGTPID